MKDTSEIKKAASYYVAAKANGDNEKLASASMRLTDMSVKYLEDGGSLEELTSILKGKGGAKKE